MDSNHKENEGQTCEGCGCGKNNCCCGSGCGGGGHHRRWLWKIPLFGVGIAGVIALKSVVVMALWNALVPELFHGPTLTFLQAVGISVLAKLLVGFGFGHHRGWHKHHRKHFWKARWAKLSPEEREKLREEIKQRCGC